MTNDLRSRVAAIASALPGAAVDHPWGGGHEAWKVGERAFPAALLPLFRPRQRAFAGAILGAAT